jgi:hypothetical protein
LNESDSNSRTFAKGHWRAFTAFGTAIAAIFAWAVYVFVWYAGNAQSSGMVPKTVGLWTMSNFITFLLYGAFWELLLVGPPLILLAGVGWTWWKRLPNEVRKVRRFGGRSRSAGGGVSGFFFIAFVIKVFLDGNWNVPISSFTLDYVVGSMVLILEWGVVILGVPAAIGLAWWLSRR